MAKFSDLQAPMGKDLDMGSKSVPSPGDQDFNSFFVLAEHQENSMGGPLMAEGPAKAKQLRGGWKPRPMGSS